MTDDVWRGVARDEYESERLLDMQDEGDWRAARGDEFGPAYQIVVLDIERWASSIRLKPYQALRDLRRQGKTSQAAARLCVYRLRRTLASEGLRMVDDITVHMTNTQSISPTTDYPRDTRLIAADVRVVKPIPGVNLPDTIRVPSTTHRLKVVRTPPRYEMVARWGAERAAVMAEYEPTDYGWWNSHDDD